MSRNIFTGSFQNEFGMPSIAQKKNELFRQNMDEDTDARHASNYQEKFNRERKYRNTIPHAYERLSAASPNYQPPSKQVGMTRPKRNPKKMAAAGNKRVVKDMPMKATSDSESDFQFIHTNEEPEIESFEDEDGFITARTFQEMESKINATTNRYIQKIRSQVFETCSKLKANPKQQQQQPKPKNYGVKFDKKASGDNNQEQYGKCYENDIVICKYQKVKAECYRKIEENLKILQQIDNASEKLYMNYLFKH